MTYIDLAQLSIPQLYAIRSLLENGSLATAGSKEVTKLRQEYLRLKTLNYRREQVTEAGLDWDEGYWMSFNDGAFEFFLNLFVEHQSQAQKETALSERKNSIRVPRIIAERELSAIDSVRQGFLERRNGRN